MTDTHGANPLAALAKFGDNAPMTDLSFSIPEPMLRWLEQRAAQSDYVDVGELLRDLVRREQRAEAEDAAWVREMIAEGEASGYLEGDAREVLKGIRAKLPNG
jgi:antitoxin ParD1/3/4